MIAEVNRRLSDIGLQPFAGLNLCRDFRAYLVATGAAVHTFNRPVTVTLTYPDTDQNGIVDTTNTREECLRVFALDENLRQWVLVPDPTINSQANTVSVLTSHFSVYTLIAHIPLSAGNVVINIYTVAGEKVKTLRENDGIEILSGEKQGRWDGRNDSGRYVASGVYLCVIRADGGMKKIEKIAICH